MAKGQTGRTRAEDVYLDLRAQILTGRMQPGQRIPVAALAEEQGVSASVVREALSRLVEQQLVDAEPHQGFAVRSLSVEALEHLTDARVAIDGLVLCRSLERGDVSWEAQLLAAHHTLARTPASDPRDRHLVNDAWVAAHAAFHRALVAGCDNPVLLDIWQKLYDAAELYRQWSVPAGAAVRERRDVPAEHQALLDAALAHDVERAVGLLGEHDRRTAALILAAHRAQREGIPSTA